MIGTIRGSRDYQASMTVSCNMQCRGSPKRPSYGIVSDVIPTFCRAQEKYATNLQMITLARSHRCYITQFRIALSAYSSHLLNSTIITSRIMKL